jgi:hypothetical protein
MQARQRRHPRDGAARIESILPPRNSVASSSSSPDRRSGTIPSGLCSPLPSNSPRSPPKSPFREPFALEWTNLLDSPTPRSFCCCPVDTGYGPPASARPKTHPPPRRSAACPNLRGRRTRLSSRRTAVSWTLGADQPSHRPAVSLNQHVFTLLYQIQKFRKLRFRFVH